MSRPAARRPISGALHLRAAALGSALALALAMLAACAQSPPTVFYTLDPMPAPATTSDPALPRPAATGDPLPIRVEAVHLPEPLNRPEIFIRQGPNVLRVDDFARWAAPLGSMTQRVLTQDLAARMPPGRVVFPDAPQPPGGVAGLSVEVLDFEVAAGEARLSVAWYLGPHARTLRLAMPSGGTAPQDSARALSELLGQLAADIAAHADEFAPRPKGAS